MASEEVCDECGKVNAHPAGVFRYLCTICQKVADAQDDDLFYEKQWS